MEFRPLSENPEADWWISQVLPWLKEAGDPYYSWFFGGVGRTDRPEPTLAAWMQRRSSEVAVARAVLLVTGDRALGGFIALGGSELQVCRRADTLAALQAAGRDRRSILAERIRQSQELFPPVAEDEFYLSKLWVAGGSRRAGHGARILREYLGTGMGQGFRRFRLDVWAQNLPAVELYLTSGFDVLRECRSDQAGMSYLHMGLELAEVDDGGVDPGPAR